MQTQNPRVAQVMTTSVLSVEKQVGAGEVLRHFREYPIHHLPVMEGPRVVGLLSSADMMKLEHMLPRGIANPKAWLDERMKAAELVRRSAITCTADATVAEAACRMASHGIHALPVVDASDHLLGIVTTTDLMAALLASTHDETGAVADHMETRVRELEELLRLVQRYLAAGQDEQLHARLTRMAEKLANTDQVPLDR
jgi:signal-transduction protein with cAMP-binding, CBS, and nucleotidyltransferase domain